LSVVVRRLWETASRRFAAAVRGRVEVLADGAWEDGAFRGVEWDALLGSRAVTCVNGLDRALLPDTAEEAFRLIRRWDVERNRRYVAFLDQAADATSRERAIALDDYRETQLWYQQDFFADLGPDRALPALPPAVATSADLREWNELIKRSLLGMSAMDLTNWRQSSWNVQISWLAICSRHPSRSLRHYHRPLDSYGRLSKLPFSSGASSAAVLLAPLAPG
jgi:hypothetical protein